MNTLLFPKVMYVLHFNCINLHFDCKKNLKLLYVIDIIIIMNKQSIEYLPECVAKM